MHSTHAVPGLLELRDFVLLCAERCDGDRVLAAHRSVEHPLAPRASRATTRGYHPKRAVRGTTSGGLLAEARPGGQVELTLLSRLDAGGVHRPRGDDVQKAAEVSMAAFFFAMEVALRDGAAAAERAMDAGVREMEAARKLVTDFCAAAQNTDGYVTQREVWVAPLGLRVPLENRLDPQHPERLGQWRAEWELDGTVEAFLGLLEGLSSNIDMAKRLTPEVEVQRVCHTIGVAGHLVQKVDKLPWPLHRRESIFLSSLAIARDGSVFLAQRSWNDHPQAPPLDEKTAVRTQIFLGGFRIMPVEGKRKVKVMQLVDVNPGGSLPQWLLKKAMDDRAIILGRLKLLMDNPPR